MSYTKWIFGGLGFVLGGPIGALVGVVIGSVFDYNVKKYDNEKEKDANKEKAKRYYAPKNQIKNSKSVPFDIVKNTKYANIIGIDIWLNTLGDTPKQYDIVVYSTYNKDYSRAVMS